MRIVTLGRRGCAIPLWATDLGLSRKRLRAALQLAFQKASSAGDRALAIAQHIVMRQCPSELPSNLTLPGQLLWIYRAFVIPVSEQDHRQYLFGYAS
jgi:hypothetical protein